MKQRLRSIVDSVGLGVPARLAARTVRAAKHRGVRVVGRIRGVLGRLADLPRARRWRRALAAELASPREPEVLIGDPSPDAQLVVMCLWKRPELIDDILNHVDSQTRVKPLRLILWNNNLETSDWNRERIGEFRPNGALQSVEYVDSPTNLMGMARFVSTRNALLAGHKGSTVITLDDDEDIPDDFFATLIERGGSDRVAGWWACLIHGTYWERTELLEDRAEANYVGTGGAIWPARIVDDMTFFTTIPSRFRTIEDLWASVWALKRGWRLTKVAADIQFVLRERDQGHVIHDLKTDFYERLR